MRKITKQSVLAFFSGTRFSSGNTTVEAVAGVIAMKLHGNVIATRVPGCGEVFISNAGWESNTTKERLNGILSYLNVSGIYQKGFVWYWNGGEKFPCNQFVKASK